MQTLLADGHDSDSWSSSVELSMDLIGFVKTGSMKNNQRLRQARAKVRVVAQLDRGRLQMQTLLADGHDSNSWSSSVELSMDLIGFVKTGSMKNNQRLRQARAKV